MAVYYATHKQGLILLACGWNIVPIKMQNTEDIFSSGTASTHNSAFQEQKKVNIN